WGGASALWSEYLAGFHAVGVGSAATAPPYIAVVTALATVLGGQAWLAVDVLLAGCVPLGRLTAYLAVRRLGAGAARRSRVGAAAAGGLGPAAALPPSPLAARRPPGLAPAPPRAARSAAWTTGLLVALTAAFVPLVWVLASGLVLLLLAARRWLRPWMRPLP